MRHCALELTDGRRVGVSVGGSGVPLVFFHGIGMDRRVYLRLLSRLPQLGFLVVAIDAPGHGDTFLPMRGSRSFGARMAATDEILDALGIRRALLIGHSMGGRTAAEIAAMRPERALGVVLIDPALGAAFDAARVRITSPAETASALLAGILDTVRDTVGLRATDMVRHLGMLGGRSLVNLSRPRVFLSAATAIARAEHSEIALRLMKEHHIPAVVVHGERDMVVPFVSALDAAQLSGATLVTLPDAFHSWVLSSPWTFVDVVQPIITRGHLGEELRSLLVKAREDETGMLSSAECVQPNSWLHEHVSRPRILGRAQPRDGLLYHQYRIWDSLPGKSAPPSETAY